MKLSLKFRDDTNQTPLLRAKIPITVLSLPFLSSVSAGDSSDLSFSLRTHFSSGPSLSLSYRPTPNPNPNAVNPFSVSLKSGVGIFGSPNNSPLVFTAHFHLHNSSSSSLVPTFSLLVKPQFGNFSLRKSTSSPPTPASVTDASAVDSSDSDTGGAFSLDRALQWKDLKGGEGYGDINGMLSGIHVTAKTSVPVPLMRSSSVVNFRWGVNFPSEGGAKGAVSRPVLVLNKIELERVEGVRKGEEAVKKKMIKKKNVDSTKVDDLELLKGVCGWMGREMEDLQRQNREIRQVLEGPKTTGGNVARVRGEDKKGGSVPPVEKASDFGRWRSKKSGGVGGEDDDVQKDWNKAGGSRMSEIESELQKALKANNGSAAS